MNAVVQRFLNAAASRSDLVVIVFVVVGVVMMVLPLPTVLVDILIAINIAVTLLVLMVALHMRTPVEYSALPAIILLTTVFRLSLAVSTTRLILVQADAGEIVRTFGEFVVSGNVVVGLVIFLIITVAQFLVITKGSERVAEVGARFTLDGMPGKQMSIDADLRSGDIDAAEARRRRRLLERESQFYGAMDGAMKFVKNDAIAGLVIIAVNLIGGIVVGVMQHGMPFGEAVHTYSLLTVGDGLIAQFPALFVSLGAGMVVTRVAGEGDGRTLGIDIAHQLTGESRALAIAAAVLVGLAVVPGLPWPIFLALGVLFAAGAWLSARRETQPADVAGATAPRTEPGATPEAEAPAPAQRPEEPPASPLRVEMGSGLAALIPATGRAAAAREIVARIERRLGLDLPPLAVVGAPRLGAWELTVSFYEVPLVTVRMPADGLLLLDDPTLAEVAGATVERSGPLPGLGEETYWVPREVAAQIQETAGLRFMPLPDCVCRVAAAVLADHAMDLLGVQETRALLARLEGTHRALVEEVARLLPIQRIAELLRRLLDEQVSIRNLRSVLEALVEWAPKEQDPLLLTEYVRIALRRQICHALADEDRVLTAVLLERTLEDVLRDAMRQTAVGTFLALPEEAALRLADRFRQSLGGQGTTRPVVVLASLDVRRQVRAFLVRNGISTPVMSYQEVAQGYQIRPVGSVRDESAMLGRVSAAAE